MNGLNGFRRKSSKLLRILVTPLDGHGHINACHGLCEELRDRGHEIIFVIDRSFAGRLKRHGFKERLVTIPDSNDCGKEYWPEFIMRNANRLNKPPAQQFGDVVLQALTAMFAHLRSMKPQYDEAIAELKPDLIIHDGYICFPAVVNSSVPWIWLFSAAPNYLLNDCRIPPYFSGLPLAGDKAEWNEFYSKAISDLECLHTKVSNYNVDNGGSALPEGQLHPLSKYLNIIMQPAELRYNHIMSDLPSNIVAVDGFVRTVSNQSFEIPKSICDKPGKLVFFSMGSAGCANVPMMTRLVGILSKCPHRFIIAKGPLKYDLPGDNLYGEPFLPQTAILPLVDLVITHGGNNTVTETFYYGKKMLVMPMFLDQHDNAQRIEECALGLKLNPYNCSETELLTAIDKLANDHQLTLRMALIGKRIRASNGKQMVADRIEKLFQSTMTSNNFA